MTSLLITACPFSYVSVLASRMTLNSNWNPDPTDSSLPSSPRMRPTYHLGAPSPSRPGFDSSSFSLVFSFLPRHQDTIRSVLRIHPGDPEDHHPAAAMVQLEVTPLPSTVSTQTPGDTVGNEDFLGLGGTGCYSFLVTRFTYHVHSPFLGVGSPGLLP